MTIKRLVSRSISDGAITGTKISATNLTTSNVVEGSNLYFSNARVYSNVITLGYITSSALTPYATISYVNNEVANLVASAPTTLDTLNELAAALGNDSNFSTTVLTLIGNKANTASLTTANVTENTNLYFSNARVSTAISSQTLSNATFSGNVSAAFFVGDGSGLTNVSGSSSLPSQTGNSGKYLTTNGTTTSWATVEAGFNPFLLAGM